MFLETIILAVLVGLITGGRLTNLGRLDFRYFYLVIAAYLIQAGIDHWGPVRSFGGYPYLHVISYFILFFVLWQNRRMPGMYLVSTGTLLNFIVIILNGGQMPVSPHTLPAELSQALAAGDGGTHNLITENTSLKFLADIFYVGYLNQNQLISIGDIVIDIGAFLLVFRGTRRVRSLE
ncbi:MAG: DUF5317 domain-containing protein [Thermincola sp.]|nr:DUF5317 domain-containing protein [Thermincola sp.]MDT3703362.1 DUF5317 domain-containing protein [Thermincola sp.]